MRRRVLFPIVLISIGLAALTFAACAPAAAPAPTAAPKLPAPTTAPAQQAAAPTQPAASAQATTAPKPAAASITLTFADGDAVGTPADAASKKFMDLVTQKTNGAVQFKFFPANQLGTYPQMMQALSTGSLDVEQLPNTFLGDYEKDWNVMGLAFAFRDQAHLAKFWASPINKEISDKFLKDQGVRIIGYNWWRPPNIIITKKPVNKVEDLSGMKMRVPEITMYVKNWTQLGTQPVVVAWPETYLALQQGLVDGVDLPIDQLYQMKFWEAAKYVTWTNHLLTNAVIAVNDKKFQSLPPNVQDALVQSTNEAGDYYTQLAQQSWKNDVPKLQAAGVNFINVDNAPFIAKMAPLAAQLEKQGLWSPGLYDKIEAIK